MQDFTTLRRKHEEHEDTKDTKNNFSKYQCRLAVLVFEKVTALAAYLLQTFQVRSNDCYRGWRHAWDPLGLAERFWAGFCESLDHLA